MRGLLGMFVPKWLDGTIRVRDSLDLKSIRIRRDTGANWERVNPVLALGEPALDLDTGFAYLGDGWRTWKELTSHLLDANRTGLGQQEILLTAQLEMVRAQRLTVTAAEKRVT